MMRSQMLTFSVALTLVAFSASSLLAATVPPAPEIDGSTLSAGVGLVVSGALILRSRWNRK